MNLTTARLNTVYRSIVRFLGDFCYARDTSWPPGRCASAEEMREMREMLEMLEMQDTDYRYLILRNRPVWGHEDEE